MASLKMDVKTTPSSIASRVRNKSNAVAPYSLEDAFMNDNLGEYATNIQKDDEVGHMSAMDVSNSQWQMIPAPSVHGGAEINSRNNNSADTLNNSVAEYDD